MLFIFSRVSITYAQEVTPQKDKTYNVAIWDHDVVGEWQFNEIAKQFDLKVNYLHFDNFKDVIDAVKTGKADFATDITYTKAREEMMYISSPTNIEYTYLFARKNISFDSLKTLAVPENTVFYRAINDQMPSMKTIEFHTAQQAIELLDNNKVDAIIGTLSHLKPMLSDGLNAELLNSNLPILPVSMGSSKTIPTELTDKFTDFLHTEKIQRELKLFLEEFRLNILKGHLSEQVDRMGIDRNKSISIKLENRGLFFKFTDDNKKQGIAYDVVMESCELIGLRCQVTSLPDEAWENMFQELLEQKIDLLGTIIESKERAKHLNFTAPFYNIELVMVKRDGYKSSVFNNISELITEKIGVIDGDYYEGYINNVLPNKKLFLYDSTSHMMNALIKGEVDYIILSRLGFYEKITNSKGYLPVQIDESIGTFHSSPLSFATSKTDEGKNLTLLFSQALKGVDVANIQNKHFVKPDWKVVFNAEHKIKQVIATVLICLLITVSVVILYLRRQATTDPLTHLKNRRYLYFKHGSGLKAGRTLIYMDIDKFKTLNDTLGHEVGDNALIGLAKKIKKHWKGQAYRMGGDEFVLITKDKPSEVERQLDPIMKLTVLNDKNEDIEIKTSYGVFYNEHNKVKLDLAVQLADKKMYQAKKQRYQQAKT